MRGRRQERIETAVDHSAAAVLGAAVAWTGFVLPRGGYGEPQLGAFAAAAGLIAYLLAAKLLRRIEPTAPKLEIRAFRVGDLEIDQVGELLLTDQAELLLTEQVELVLTDADRLDPPTTAPAGELLLDDILAELGPGSPVVRLFDPSEMPTAGQLDERIQQHLGEGRSPTAPPDASQALHEALAELKRSLR